MTEFQLTIIGIGHYKPHDSSNKNKNKHNKNHNKTAEYKVGL